MIGPCSSLDAIILLPSRTLNGRRALGITARRLRGGGAGGREAGAGHQDAFSCSSRELRVSRHCWVVLRERLQCAQRSSHCVCVCVCACVRVCVCVFVYSLKPSSWVLKEINGLMETSHALTRSIPKLWPFSHTHTHTYTRTHTHTHTRTRTHRPTHTDTHTHTHTQTDRHNQSDTHT